MKLFVRAFRRSSCDHESVFAEFGMRLLGILVGRRRRPEAPRFRVVR